MKDPHGRAFARVTGLLYLTIALSGGFAIAYVPSQLHVDGNATATLASIASQGGLFMAGILADVVMMSAEIAVTALLYVMFRSVNPALSLVAALARFAMVAVMATMLLFHAGLWAIASQSEILSTFSDAQRSEIGYLLLQMHDAGVWVWQIFFMIHLVILGQLVVRSGAYPAVLGHALSIGGLGYGLDSLVASAMPDAALLGGVRFGLLGIVTLAEIGFALLLTFRGPRPDAKGWQLAA
jgi:hypothetical protein